MVVLVRGIFVLDGVHVFACGGIIVASEAQHGEAK
jgi:hypothetical protein